MMQSISTLIILGIAFAGAWFGIPCLYRWWSVRDLSRRCKERRAIVLTYDDGPSETLTSDLAKLLKRRGVHATFFVIGREATKNPATLKRLQQDGHEIGNHTMDHFNAWKTGPFRALDDIRGGQMMLEELGENDRILRPPFGKSTLLTLLYSLSRGMRLAFWTHDSRDSWDRLPIQELLTRIETDGGGVLLMHDFVRPRRGPSPEQHHDYILRLTESVIDCAETSDFKLVPLRDLFETNTPKPAREHA